MVLREHGISPRKEKIMLAMNRDEIYFSPILLLYHVAEIEILARKEIFVFIGLLLFF